MPISITLLKTWSFSSQVGQLVTTDQLILLKYRPRYILLLSLMSLMVMDVLVCWLDTLFLGWAITVQRSERPKGGKHSRVEKWSHMLVRNRSSVASPLVANFTSCFSFKWLCKRPVFKWYLSDQYLSDLYNHCIASCHWPKNWKRGEWVPVHIKNDRWDMENYRPVSVQTITNSLWKAPC